MFGKYSHVEAEEKLCQKINDNPEIYRKYVMFLKTYVNYGFLMTGSAQPGGVVDSDRGGACGIGLPRKGWPAHRNSLG